LSDFFASLSGSWQLQMPLRIKTPETIKSHSVAQSQVYMTEKKDIYHSPCPKKAEAKNYQARSG
jgi:hypothetical protein